MKRYYFILKEGAHQSSIDHPHNGLNPVGMKGTQKSSITIHKNVNSHRMAYKIQQCKKRGNSKALILRSLNIPKLYVMKLRRLFSIRDLALESTHLHRVGLQVVTSILSSHFSFQSYDAQTFVLCVISPISSGNDLPTPYSIDSRFFFYNRNTLKNGFVFLINFTTDLKFT